MFAETGCTPFEAGATLGIHVRADTPRRLITTNDTTAIARWRSWFHKRMPAG